MLTLHDVLTLPALHGARLVAGAGGASNIVRWVHVTGVPDAPDWLNGGEFVLTTSINMPPEADGQHAYIAAMAEKGVAALAIAVGRYIDETPASWRAVADSLGFPLVEVPYQARFVDIARAVNQHVIDQHYVMLERALHIHQVLTQLVLNGRDLKDLARTMADLIGQSISIENERFEALASHNIADIDEARRYTLSEGRTNPRLLQTLEERRYLREIRATLRPVQLPRIPEVGLEMERILAPIVVHGDIYGYLWIIADDRPLNELDRLAIESGATIAALMLFYQEAVTSAEASLKGGLLAQLIDLPTTGANGREAVLTDQALRYGVDLTAPFVMLMIDPGARTGSNRLLQVYRRVDRLARLGEWRAVVGQFAGQVVVLAQYDSGRGGGGIVPILDAIHVGLAEGNDEPSRSSPGDVAGKSPSSIRIAVSAMGRGAAGAAAAHHQCRDALDIARRLGMDAPTIHFEALGYLHALYKAGADSLRGNAHAERLRPLLAETEADLFHTLEVYLDKGANGVQTADALCIHRSTLNYRLQQIEKLCGLGGTGLSDPVLRTNLQIALKLLRLFEMP
ncbi:MAG: PucR family transcriptional regulator ligand-binding domain-containing protein [bacterium]|nr:PucR family transcriptional regulator ligand-binding domain-containing protein [bacterium]